MDSKKLKKRKRQADKRMRIFEELSRPVTYVLDDVKETVITVMMQFSVGEIASFFLIYRYL